MLLRGTRRGQKRKLEQFSQIARPGELNILLGDRQFDLGFRSRFAELNPASDANVVQYLKEPFEFRMVQRKSVPKIGFGEPSRLAEKGFNLLPIFLLLLRERLFQQILVFPCFIRFGRMPGAKMSGDKHRVSPKERKEHLTLHLANQKEIAVFVAGDKLHWVPGRLMVPLHRGVQAITLELMDIMLGFLKILAF